MDLRAGPWLGKDVRGRVVLVVLSYLQEPACPASVLVAGSPRPITGGTLGCGPVAGCEFTRGNRSRELALGRSFHAKGPRPFISSLSQLLVSSFHLLRSTTHSQPPSNITGEHRSRCSFHPSTFREGYGGGMLEQEGSAWTQHYYDEQIRRPDPNSVPSGTADGDKPILPFFYSDLCCIAVRLYGIGAYHHTIGVGNLPGGICVVTRTHAEAGKKTDIFSLLPLYLARELKQ